MKEEEAEMTRYQEEMLSRVMELHQIAKGGMIANWMSNYHYTNNVSNQQKYISLYNFMCLFILIWQMSSSADI